MTIIIKCPYPKSPFSKDHIVDITDATVRGIWEEFRLKPYKGRTLYPWVGPTGEWSFFYNIQDDGRFLVIDINHIPKIIQSLKEENDIQYLKDILAWSRDSKLSKLF